MTKESPFGLEYELEELEKELEPLLMEVEAPPANAEFRDCLRQRLEEALENKSAANAEIPVYKKILASFTGGGSGNTGSRGDKASKERKRGFFGNRKLRLVASFALVILMFFGLFKGLDRLGIFLQPVPVNAAEISITALEQDKLGIEAETAFMINSQEPLDEKTIRDTLKISPAVDYDLEKGDGGREYKIIPRKVLAANTVYRLSFDPSGQDKDSFSWAFQTKGVFRVIRSLPADKTTHVPVSTGIEIAFSHENLDINKVKEYVEINPATTGRFEQHKKTVVFVPQELKAGTLYTVTVKKGFPLAQSTETLGENYSFSFETAPEDKTAGFIFDLGSGVTEFARGEIPVFPAFYYTNSAVPAAAVKVYQYPDAASYIKSLAKRDEIPYWTSWMRNLYSEDFTGLAVVEDFKTDFLTVDTYTHYVVFPKALPDGCYAAEIKAGETVRQVWFQVTNLAAYLALGEEKSLLWVNDLTTKAPVSDVKMKVVGMNLDFKGDSAGVVVIDKSLGLGTGEGKVNYATVKSAAGELVVPLDARDHWLYNKTTTNARDYWKYLYLDRELFKPGDVINFWGVLAPRTEGIKEVGEVRIELRGGYRPYYEGYEETPILSQTVRVEGSTYTGSIKLPVLKPDYYYLRVMTGETILLSRGFSVEIYQKPAYSLEITPEKKAIFAGEGMNFETAATFFEGTPVPALKLNYSINDKSGVVTTDEKGRALIPFIGEAQGQTSPYSYQYLGVSANLPEAGEINGSSWVYVFRSKVHLVGEAARQQGDAFSVQTQLSRVDLSKINDGEYPAEENFVSGPAGNTLVKGSIYQNIWEREETGEHYDFISKKVVKTYYHKHSTQHVSDFSMITDENGRATYSGMLSPDNSYYIELTAQDNEGRETKRRINVPGSAGGNPDDDYKYYYLKNVKEVKGYKTGDEVKVVMMENEQEASARPQGYLYFLGQKQLGAYTVSDSPFHSFTFTEQHIPNVNVYGVYFDGQFYQEAASCLAPFDRVSKALQVKVETDKPEYRPGETVKLSVEVSGADGRGTAAEVNLNLVDEALYSLRNQQTDLLSSLYGDYIYPLLTTWKSHYHPQYGGGAEMGGEGDGERKDFRDTVLFTTLTTGSDGKATAEFQLPDNLTSWRVTYHALTPAPGLFAASGTRQIPVRLPFFVELTTNDVCLAGDAPVVILRSYGEKLRSGQAVSYRMKLVAPDGAEIAAQGQSTSFTAYDWNLPVLHEGRYTLTVEGESNGLRDKITREITVVRSFLERTVSHFELLRDDLQLNQYVTGKEPIEVIFSDYEKAQYLQGLHRLAWQNGSRFEQELAAQEARRLLARYFPDEKIYPQPGGIEPLLSFQQQDGGISILPYAESELRLTALAASCSGEDFDQKALAAYFYKILEDEGKEDDKSLALWGLAALKEPVLLQVEDYLLQPDLTPSEKINLVLAMLDLGDGAAAKEVFGELVKQYSEDLGTTMRMKVGRDQDEMIEATTQMAMLGARLEHPLKNKLYQYLLENQAKDALNLVEQAIILEYNLKYMDTAPVSFTYELNGQKTTKTLQDLEILKLTVLPEDAPNLKFSNIEGKVGTLVIAASSYAASDIKPQQDLLISRSYRVGNKQVTTLGRSDLVEVTISYTIGDKAPAGCYEIVDVLPAGLRYVTRPYDRNVKQGWYLAYPTEVKGQKLTFAVGKSADKLTYYARVVAPGEYKAEPALLNNIGSGGISKLTGQDGIVIK